ncbi:RcnB family protein [Dyella telluris]|nr:RcnB family protein [Dyella telluris]
MKKTLFALMIGAVMVSGTVAASPQQYDDHHDQQDHDRYDHGHDRDHDHDHDRGHDHDHDRDYDRGYDHDHDRRDYVIVHDRGNHEGWYHRGGYVPAEYYRDQRYYADYRVYHLAPPPPEHVWVRSDTGDFLLVAVATGIIADMVINH